MSGLFRWLKEAEKTLKGEAFDSSVLASYIVMFHSARAILFFDGFVEFMLAVTELIGIQEKTNYPTGSLTESLYKDFGEKDRFSVIQKAVWRGNK